MLWASLWGVGEATEPQVQLPVREAANGCITGEAVRPPLSGASALCGQRAPVAGWAGPAVEPEPQPRLQLVPWKAYRFPQGNYSCALRQEWAGSSAVSRPGALNPGVGQGRRQGPLWPLSPRPGIFSHPKSQELPSALGQGLYLCSFSSVANRAPVCSASVPGGMGRSLPPSQVPLEFPVPRGQ